AGWPLEERLKFGSLCSALAVQQFGGSLAAPGWGDITDWWRSLSSAADGGDLRAAYTRGGYQFLDDVVPDHRVQGRRRATGTCAPTPASTGVVGPGPGPGGADQPAPGSPSARSSAVSDCSRNSGAKGGRPNSPRSAGGTALQSYVRVTRVPSSVGARS